MEKSTKGRTGGHTAGIIHVVIRHVFLRLRIQVETVVDSVHFPVRHSPVRRRRDVDVRELVQEPRPQIPRQRISHSPELIRRPVHGDARPLGPRLLWCVEGEPGGTEGHDVRAANEDAVGKLASVVAVPLGERLHPGRQSHEFWVGIRNGGVGYARDDRARHAAEAGLREAGQHGRAGGDVLEYLADEGGVAHVFEEGVVGGAGEGFLGVGDGRLEEWRQGRENAGYLRRVGAAALDGVETARYDVAGG